MRSQERSGEGISTRSGRTWRMTLEMSRRSSREGVRVPSGQRRKRTSLTPTHLAAASCSASRPAGTSERGTSGKYSPASPLVTTA